MRPEDFRKIDDYFSRARLAPKSAKLAYDKFIESVETRINEHHSTNDSYPDEATIRGFCDAYLIDATLDTYVQLARVDEDAEKNRMEKLYSKKGRLHQWIISLFTSMLAGFLLLVLLLISYKIGQDQWKSLLGELDITERPPSIEAPSEGASGLNPAPAEQPTGN